MAALPRLADPTAALDALLALLPHPVPARQVPLAAAVGRVLAEALLAPAPVPPAPVAARDGWAVVSTDTQGAGAYSPAPLPDEPRWVRSGCVLPTGTDAVLPDWSVLAGPPAQAVDPIAPGEGVRLPGEDLEAGATLCRSLQRLPVTALPALHSAGFDSVAVHEPRVAIICCGDEVVADPRRDGLGPWLAALLIGEGSKPLRRPAVPDDAAAISGALLEAAATADLLLLAGGTGLGRDDFAEAALAAAGRVVLHGLASRPGGTAGIGTVAETAVVLVPGSWEDAYAVWLLLVRPALRRLTGQDGPEPRRARLIRKVASVVGLLDLVPVRCAGPGLVEPLATGALSPGALAAADAVIFVPPASEGYDAGAEVALEQV